MKKQIMTVALVGASLLVAGCASNADRRAKQYAEAGTQMDYNIAVVKSEQDRIEAEKYRAEQDKLDALSLRKRELKVRLAELQVKEREAKVGTTVAEEAARTETAREKVQLELDRTRAEIQQINKQ